MPALTVKSVPDRLYKQLKRSAVVHRRSLNSEILMRLERSLQAKRLDPEAFLARVSAFRASLRVPPLTDEFLREAKNEGRL